MIFGVPKLSFTAVQTWRLKYSRCYTSAGAEGELYTAGYIMEQGGACEFYGLSYWQFPVRKERKNNEDSLYRSDDATQAQLIIVFRVLSTFNLHER